VAAAQGVVRGVVELGEGDAQVGELACPSMINALLARAAGLLSPPLTCLRNASFLLLLMAKVQVLARVHFGHASQVSSTAKTKQSSSVSGKT
jgi:hypothetical protein